MSTSRVRVVTLNAALGPLDYRVPDGMAVEPGSIVVAPLGPRQLLGVAWEAERLQTNEVPDTRLRPLARALDLPPIAAPLRRLCEWTADYYLAPLASVLRMVLPSSAALEGSRQLIEYRRTPVVPERMTPQREKALAAIEGRQGTVRELADHAGVSDAQVTVGARSALFLPYPNLGLIVIDEAHEPSFKQEDGVQYHARDTAVMRAKFEDIPVILSSATPAIESRHMVEIGRYREVSLPERFAGASLPEIRAIDLTEDPPPRGRWLAPTLVNELEANLAREEQSLLFLNRRGFAPLTLCRHCGHRFQCPNCTAWMVEHRLTHRLACHHCGHVMPPPKACPECGEEDSLVACGPGVERIADEVAELFPEARTAIVTSDTIWSPLRAAEFVGAMEVGEIDVVVGTQLVTKGYHFPNLTLVGVVDADLGLAGGDLRAAERSFQQIQQVAGRAGRGDKRGRVFVQTHDPDAPVIATLVSADVPGFYAAETEARREAAMPPFGRLAAIVISAEDASEAEAVARRIGHAAPQVEGMAVFGPAPAPLAMLRGRHRQRLLVHARRSLDVQDVIRDWLAALDWSAKVRVSVDVDPYSFL